MAKVFTHMLQLKRLKTIQKPMQMNGANIYSLQASTI